MRPLRVAAARLGALVRSDPAGFRAGFVALLVSALGSVAAGLTLGSITGTLEELPGLLVLLPAAIGMRGNVFGSLGSRLGTAIHTGSFRLSGRIDTLVGQNLAASLSLSLSVALVLALLAKAVSVAFGVEGSISVADFVVISIVGGFVSSVIVMLITVGVAGLSARRDWDFDNVSAPIVTTAGDVVTLPALFLATYLVQLRYVTSVLATLCAAVAVVALVAAARSGLPILRQIVRESLPVLAVAGAVDIVAGLTVEGQLEELAAFPVLLVLIPPFLGQSGSLGGILTSRISTKLHLGLVSPERFSLRPVMGDVALIVAYAVPVYVLVGLTSDFVALLADLNSPGALDVVLAALLAGLVMTGLIVLVAYAAALVTYRLGLDPDNHGIPIVTSSLDLLGAVALILTFVALGLT